MISTSLSLTYEAKLRLLMILDPKDDYRQLNNCWRKKWTCLNSKMKSTRVQSEVDKSQREFYLREQMKQIQTELGEGDIFTRDANDLKKRVEAASLPEEAKMVALKELERLNQMPPMAPEVGIIRTYIDWILDLPWSNFSPDNLDVKNAAKTLERDHYGLKKAKEEFSNTSRCVR
jgi:ATP-dependent Lon protease